MGTFKTWLLEENDQPLRRDEREKVASLYDQVVRLLLGGAKDQTHLSLSDISDDAPERGQPPKTRGPSVVLEKLQKSGLFDKIAKLGNPQLVRRSEEVQRYLQQVGTDQKVGPSDTVGQLLNKLFGDDAVEMYGKGLYKTQPMAPKQAPRNDAKDRIPDDATTSPMSAQQEPNPQDQGQNPQEPAPAMPPQQNPMMPPQPEQDLPTSPMGPMPPRPPGGLF